MKAFLLAAGHGTRLRPFTNRLPKCLVPIRGVPILGIWLEICRRTGITEVLINLHAHAELVREYVEENANGVTVHLSDEPFLLGSAGTLLAHRDWVERDDCFWVLYGDVLTTADLRRMHDFHRGRRMAATLGLYQVPDPTRCGIVTADENHIVREFVEKPESPSSNWAFSGLLIGTGELLQAIPPRRPSDLGFDVLPRLAGRMSAHRFSEYVQDIGTVENYQAAQNNWPGLISAEQTNAASDHL